jgi:hypothetical protein
VFSGNVFLAVEVLGFFAELQGPTDRGGGFRSLEELLSDMASMGFEEEEVRSKVQQLVKYKMLAYDGEDFEAPTDTDLIKITPSGFIHLRSLPHFIEYISSIAIHAPMDDAAVARRIAGIWDRATHFPDLTFLFKHEVASMLLEYLIRHKNRLDAANPLFKARCREAEHLIRSISHAVNSTRKIAAGLRAKSASVAEERRAAAKERSANAPRRRMTRDKPSR